MNKSLLKQVAGKFATGVTVVTTKDSDGIVRGITANSFVSISLDPPLVGFSVMQESYFLNLIDKGSKLGISILSQDHVPTSNRFAGIDDGGDHAPDEFDIINECPVLLQSIGWYAVNIKEQLLMGDHIFMVCEILDLGFSTGQPLVYYSGYKSIGNEL